MITTISKEARHYLKGIPRDWFPKLTNALEMMLETERRLPYPEYGICSNLVSLTDDYFTERTVQALGAAWPYRTKARSYPVPSPHYPLHSEEQGLEAAVDAYNEAELSEYQWVGAMGSYRCSLVQFMLAQVELYLAEVDNV